MIEVCALRLENEFWKAHILLRGGLAQFTPGVVVTLPQAAGVGVSRARNKAIAYALEDLAAKLKEAP